MLKRHKLQHTIKIIEDEVLPHADNQASHLVNIHSRTKSMNKRINSLLTILNDSSTDLVDIQRYTTHNRLNLSTRVFTLKPLHSNLNITVTPHCLAIGPYLVPGLTPAEHRHIHTKVNVHHMHNSGTIAVGLISSLFEANSHLIAKSSNDIPNDSE